VSAWIAAAKPASWPKLLVPTALGQALGFAAAGRLSLAALGVGVLFAVLDLLFIVFLNDWGDREVDAIKRRMFPRSSRKTLPDGLLPARQLLVAGLLAGGLALGLSALAGWLLDRPWLAPFAAGALLVFVAYTLPPLRLNYRGGGELLEMLGVGVVLPWLHHYLQSGALTPGPGFGLLPGFALMSLASAIASGLSDERSDRRGGKRTVVSTLGNRVGRGATLAAGFGGAALLAAGPSLDPGLPSWCALPAAGLALFHLGGAASESSAAVTDAFEAQRRLKGHLHRAIWRGALLAAALLAASALVERWP
jgi:1,4-dihydroxy-2-naphthoate octaprenyltransferase